jgi:hypothetical protein
MEQSLFYLPVPPSLNLYGNDALKLQPVRQRFAF